MEKLIVSVLWGLTILGSVIGGAFGLFAILSADGAPQEAAGAAIGVFLAVVPYCLARAVSKIGQKSSSK